MNWGILKTVWRDRRTSSALGAYLGGCLLRLGSGDRMACPDLPKQTDAHSCQHLGYTLDGSDAVGTRQDQPDPGMPVSDTCTRRICNTMWSCFASRSA